MEPHLRRVLLAENPWLSGQAFKPWAEQFLPEPYIPRRLRLESGPRVALVVGPRQAGKSTLIWKTLAERDEPALYINCEEPELRSWLGSPAAFLADLAEWTGQVRTVFFEEIQRLPEAGLFLKGVVDRRTGLRLFATGSSSFELEAATRESLAGRANRYLLLPLSLSELGATHGENPLVRAEARSRMVERVLLFGGYPSVITATDPGRELAGLVQAFVVRDLSDRFRIRHLDAFRKVMQLAASQVGNLVNLTEWAAMAGVSRETVADYVRLLEETHVLRLLRPFVGGKRAEITGARKVFFVDNGIRNQLFGGFSALDERGDRGALYENLVFTELAKTLDPLLDGLSCWRSKSGAEMDFVVEHQGRVLAVEVKAGDSRRNLSRSARSFVEAYRPERLLVVHGGGPAETTLGGVEVRFLPVEQLAAAVEEFLAK